MRGRNLNTRASTRYVFDRYAVPVPAIDRRPAESVGAVQPHTTPPVNANSGCSVTRVAKENRLPVTGCRRCEYHRQPPPTVHLWPPPYLPSERRAYGLARWFASTSVSEEPEVRHAMHLTLREPVYLTMVAFLWTQTAGLCLMAIAGAA